VKQKIFRADTDYILVDVRSKATWDLGHLLGSTIIEPGTPEANLVLQLTMLTRTSLAIFYDDGFGSDAILMADKLINLHEGYNSNNVVVLTGGYFNWLKAGYQVEIDGL
jgi:rhodanese-related sulfurtransferase